MAEMVVSAAKGVIGSLLAKLTDLIGDNYFGDLLGVSKDIVFLRDELGTINVLLDKLQDTNDLDPQVKNWRDQVREMSFDIVDCIDDFISKVGSTDANPGFITKVSCFLQTLRAYLGAAMQIKELKTRLHEINERRKRYKLFEDSTSRTTLVDADLRLSALYKESTMIVGIKHQMKQIVTRIMDGEQQLKVLPIVGFGGSGKTTLANEVYREVRRHFDCTTFVSVSQKPDITQLLSLVLSQLFKQQSSHGGDVQYHIDSIREYLQGKRYLIVIDDLWSVVPEWDIISSCFPQNDKHSRIIVTTRIMDVARACCSDHGSIHRMVLLSEQYSRKLFFNRIFGLESTCPPQLENISCKILKKCGGLPLAIMTVASTIACSSTSQTVEEWEGIHDSLVAQFATNPTMETMIHILELSYKNLPRHLKSCFLHLGIYPEDWEIKRDDVVRQWVAEGFVRNIQGKDVWDVAKSYFNELVNRSIIQPFGFGIEEHEVLSCTVHDMMLELITRKCREENFIVVLHDPHALAGLQVKVRRLSADFRDIEYGTMPVASAGRLSQVRSVIIFGESKWDPNLMEFKFLRVLYLECRGVVKVDLACICLLFQLRYLKVRCRGWISNNERIVLPAQIRKLQQLETLDLDKSPGCTIPSDITDLPCLSYLSLPINTRLPHGTCKMKSLRTLIGPCLPKSILEDVTGLGELTNLEKLSLNCEKPLRTATPTCSSEDDTTVDQETWMAALSSSLEKLRNLEEFFLRSYLDYNADALLRSSSGVPLQRLKHLKLSTLTFSRVPKWMAHLHSLCRLYIAVKQVLQQDIGIIGALPTLHCLGLQIPSVVVPTERIVIGSTTGFAVLRILSLDCDRLSFLTFEAGAMPKLHMLIFAIDEREWDKATPSGLHHLYCLRNIQVSKMGSDGSPTRSEVTDDIIRTIFQEAANAVPSRPEVFVVGTWRREVLCSHRLTEG